MITIYTAIFGVHDSLKEPLFFDNKRFKYICYTDQDFKSDRWKIIKTKVDEPDSRRQARKVKILSHLYTDTEMSIWIDGSCVLLKDPTPYLNFKEDLVVSKHPKRNCIYEEAKRCIEIRKGDPQRIREQVKKYENENYPKNNGLVETTVLIRRITPKMIKIENEWWNELKNGCVRDQVSFNYVAWKNNFKYRLFNFRKIAKRMGHDRLRSSNPRL